MFICQHPGSALVWTVDLPGGTITESVASSQAGRVLTFANDPGFEFEVHVLSSSSASSIISELCVIAVKQLNGVTVECIGPSGNDMSTIQVMSGEFTHNNSHIHNNYKYSKAYLNFSDIGTHINIKIHQLLQVEL